MELLFQMVVLYGYTVTLKSTETTNIFARQYYIFDNN